MIPDQNRAPLVKKAFELYGTGRYSKIDILKMVSNLGLRTRKGKLLSAQTLHNLLRNPIYAGWISVRKWGELKRGSFEPLISQQTFDRVQAFLLGKKSYPVPHVRNHPDFPLRQSVRCGLCDNPLTGSWSKGRSRRYAYYRCPSSACKGVNIRKEKLEKLFIEMLERLSPRSGNT